MNKIVASHGYKLFLAQLRRCRCRQACHFMLNAHTLTFLFGGNFKFDRIVTIQFEKEKSISFTQHNC